MYWHIGERINREVLDNQRAEYVKQIVAQVARQLQKMACTSPCHPQIVATVSQQLQAEYGEKGFEKSSITRMMKFAKLFPDEQIVSQTATQLR